MVGHFSDHHEGQQQEILFRTVAQFKKALERQVWKSVEIDSTISTLGWDRCLNNKTEWGMSKDPALIHRKSPLRMGVARAQREGQTSGNTTKRVVVREENPRPLKRSRQEDTAPEPNRGRDHTPDESQRQGPTPAPETPKRSRWSRWKSTLDQGPNSGVPQELTQPTRSGLLGPLASLRRTRAPRQPPPVRVGNGGEDFTDIWNLEEERRPPNRDPSQGRTQGSLA